MDKGIKHLINTALLSSLLLLTLHTIAAQPPNPTRSMTRFIDTMVKKHHFDRTELTHLLRETPCNQSVIKHITNPYEAEPWEAYRKHFVTQKRIAGGVAYWKKHKKSLQYATQHYGVPASIITAIIGVETNYGAEKGQYSALSALNTLAFYYPKRARFFTKELAQFLLLSREQQLPARQIKSSYAGAIGIPQFMPSTYRHYAVDYTKKGRIDLTNDDNDAIASVANYLYVYRWKAHQPIAVPIKGEKRIPSRLVSSKAKPKRSIKQLKKRGIIPLYPVNGQLKAAITPLNNKKGQTYWLTFHNFKVILRYNTNINYAMAIYQLSKAIQDHYEPKRRSTPATPSRKTG